MTRIFVLVLSWTCKDARFQALSNLEESYEMVKDECCHFYGAMGSVTAVVSVMLVFPLANQHHQTLTSTYLLAAWSILGRAILRASACVLVKSEVLLQEHGSSVPFLASAGERSRVLPSGSLVSLRGDATAWKE